MSIGPTLLAFRPEAVRVVLNSQATTVGAWNPEVSNLSCLIPLGFSLGQGSFDGLGSRAHMVPQVVRDLGAIGVTAQHRLNVGERVRRRSVWRPLGFHALGNGLMKWIGAAAKFAALASMLVVARRIGLEAARRGVVALASRASLGLREGGGVRLRVKIVRAAEQLVPATHDLRRAVLEIPSGVVASTRLARSRRLGYGGAGHGFDAGRNCPIKEPAELKRSPPGQSS